MNSKYYKILKTITKDLKKKDAGIININIEYKYIVCVV